MMRYNTPRLKILLIAPVHYGAKGQWFLRAFCGLGHRIMLINQCKYFPGITKTILKKIIGRLKTKLNLEEYNREIYRSAVFFRPDLTVIMKGLRISPDTLRQIKEKVKSTKIFNINYDDFFSKYKTNVSDYLYKSIPIYDCLFTTRKINIKELLHFGAKRVEYLPFCYDPNVLYPVVATPSEYETYKSDVVFIGSFEKDRADKLESLANFDLAIWGNQWNRLKSHSHIRRHLRHKDVYELEFSKVLNCSKIALNFFRKGNRDVLNSRTFEMPACGAFIIAERTEEQAGYFEEGKEIVCFSDAEELREKVSYYLKHDEEREKIAGAVYERLKKEKYTVQDRVSNVLDVFSEL